jgi:hypothetical protein
VNSPRVEKNQLHVHARPEHEHILMQLDLCDGRWRQRVSHSDESQVLDESRSVAFAIVVCVVVDSSLQVSRTMYHLREATRNKWREKLSLIRFRSVIGWQSDITIDDEFLHKVSTKQ